MVYKNLAFVIDGFADPTIYAIRLEGEGDVTDSHVKWKYGQRGPSTPSPILVGQQLLFISDKGILSSINARTGKLRWRKRIGGNFSASPIVSKGLVFVFDREGKTTIVRPGKTARIIAVNELDEGLMASAAIAKNALILRTSGHLYCIAE